VTDPLRRPSQAVSPPRESLGRRARSALAPGWRDTLILYALVALGASIGGVFRALASLGVLELTPAGFPWGTLLVNAVGSLAIGFYATLTEPGGRVFASARQRQFVMTGICGGFTTFSLFSLETLQLLHGAGWSATAMHVTASVVIWLVSVWLGYRLAARINR
jgi:fluoride exporter